MALGSGSVIGSLSVQLGLNSAAFIADMSKAAASVATSASEMKASLASISTGIDAAAGAAKGLVAALAVQQVVGFATRSLEAAANIARLAQTVGLTTDQFQKYQIAALQVGIDQERFNVGIQRFASNLGAAKEGTGSLTQSLGLMNPQLLQQMISAKNTNDAFLLLIHAMGGMTDTSERSRVSMAAFGRGMQQAGLIATELGSDLNTKLAMPAAVIDGARQLQEQLNLAETAITNGFTTGLVAAFAGDLETSDDVMVKFTKDAQQFGFIVGQSIQVVVLGIKSMTDWWNNTNAAIDKWSQMGNDKIASLSQILNMLALGDNSAVAMAGHAFEHFWQVVLHGNQPDLPELTFDGMGKALKTVGAAIPTLSFDGFRTELGLDIKETDDFTTALNKLIAMFHGQGGVDNAVEDASLANQKWEKDLQTSNGQLAQMIATVNKGPIALEQLKAQFAATDEVQKKNIPTNSALGQSLIALLSAQKNLQFSLATSERLHQEALTPLELYRQKILEITLAEKNHGITAQQAAVLANRAALSTADEYIKAGAAITGAMTSIFQKNKAFAIANAVVNTAEAVVAALKNPPGPPFSYAYAAAAAATGAAQIASIVSAQPGSASTSPVSSSSAKIGSGEAPSYQQAISINLQGDTFGRAQVENLVGQLKLYQKDGGSILLT